VGVRSYEQAPSAGLWKNTCHLDRGLDSGLNFRMLARNDEQNIDSILGRRLSMKCWKS
jgi:hypothetical protein